MVCHVCQFKHHKHNTINFCKYIKGYKQLVVKKLNKKFITKFKELKVKNMNIFLTFHWSIKIVNVA